MYVQNPRKIYERPTCLSDGPQQLQMQVKDTKPVTSKAGERSLLLCILTIYRAVSRASHSDTEWKSPIQRCTQHAHLG